MKAKLHNEFLELYLHQKV